MGFLSGLYYKRSQIVVNILVVAQIWQPPKLWLWLISNEEDSSYPDLKKCTSDWRPQIYIEFQKKKYSKINFLSISKNVNDKLPWKNAVQMVWRPMNSHPFSKKEFKGNKFSLNKNPQQLFFAWSERMQRRLFEVQKLAKQWKPRCPIPAKLSVQNFQSI